MKLVSVRSLFEQAWPQGTDACVLRHTQSGKTLAAAQRLCWQNPADTSIQPADPGDIQRASEGAVRGFGSRASYTRGGGVKLRRGPVLAAESGAVSSVVGYWGGRDLGTGTVTPRNGRAEAHVWAKEVAAVGQNPPYERGGWAEHARRMGLSPEEESDGWDYLKVLSKRPSQEGVVRSLKHVLPEGQGFGMWAGFSMPGLNQLRMPQDTGAKGWPFRTKAAEVVFDAAAQIAQKNPKRGVEDVFGLAMQKAQIEPHELTPEDDALMRMAIHWVLSGKYPVPQQPPEIPRARSAGAAHKGADYGSGYLKGRGPPP